MVGTTSIIALIAILVIAVFVITEPMRDVENIGKSRISQTSDEDPRKEL
jgi:hypothetical protein